MLDLGAGQGRNTLPLIERGFSVRAVDLSIRGLKQIRKAVRRKRLDSSFLEIEKADYYTVSVPENTGMILLDSVLSFDPEKKDVHNEWQLLERLTRDLLSGGRMCLTLVKNFENAEALNRLKKSLFTGYETELETEEVHDFLQVTYLVYAGVKPA